MGEEGDEKHFTDNVEQFYYHFHSMFARDIFVDIKEYCLSQELRKSTLRIWETTHAHQFV